MMTLEETRVLNYLRKRRISLLDEIARACLPASSREDAVCILSNLEWLGYVVRFGTEAVQITQRGKSAS